MTISDLASPGDAKSYKRWSYQEYRALKAMKHAGYNVKAMARALHRGVDSVNMKIRELSFGRPKVKILKAPDIPATPKVSLTIPHAAIPTWYALGWRFVGFHHDGLYIFEWQSERETRYPYVEGAA